MTILQAFLQGILQGITEFLPISSSGHLSLFQYFTGNSGEAGFLFSILLHAGTLIAVCIVFRRTIWALAKEAFGLLRDLLSGRFDRRNMAPARRMLLYLILSLLPLAAVVAGKDFVETFSTDPDITVEGFCFFITGVALMLAARQKHGRKDAGSMNGKDALAVGAAQAIATVPGISRSGFTIGAGLLRGFERGYAVSYSFILGIPAVLGAIVLELGGVAGSGVAIPISAALTGLASSAIAGIFSIRLVQLVVKGNHLRWFGYYTLALGVIVMAVGAIDHATNYSIQRVFLSWF